MGFSPTIQLLGIPHDYENLHFTMDHGERRASLLWRSARSPRPSTDRSRAGPSAWLLRPPCGPAAWRPPGGAAGAVGDPWNNVTCIMSVILKWYRMIYIMSWHHHVSISIMCRVQPYTVCCTSVSSEMVSPVQMTESIKPRFSICCISSV